MVSYIYISTMLQTGIDRIKEQTNQLNIAPIDLVNLELETGDKATTSIGIAEIKRLMQKIYLKPLQSPDKAIIIKDAQTLTPEAQNALLKVLEEPPAHTYIYLLTTNLNSILSTIQSRCSIINLELERRPQEDTRIIIPDAIGDKLVLAEKYGKQKATAISFLQNLLITYHHRLHTEAKKKHILGAILETEKSLKLLQSTNVNPRLTLEHVLLTCITE